MQVVDITDLFSDNNQMINICDLRDGNAEDVYTGPISSMPFEYDRCEVCSLDPLDDRDILTINIDTSDR